MGEANTNLILPVGTQVTAGQIVADIPTLVKKLADEAKAL